MIGFHKVAATVLHARLRHFSMLTRLTDSLLNGQCVRPAPSKEQKGERRKANFQRENNYADSFCTIGIIQGYPVRRTSWYSVSITFFLNESQLQGSVVFIVSPARREISLRLEKKTLT